MNQIELTDAKFMVLGLLAEMPRHGYQLEQVIEQRGMREWTRIGFSSIYFVLGKLEKKGLIGAEKPTSAKAKKTYIITTSGREALVVQTLSALKDVRPTYSSVLLGMAHWPVVAREQALEALRARATTIDGELVRLENTLAAQQPLPDFVGALFDYSLSQLKAEAEWIRRTIDNMKTKP